MNMRGENRPHSPSSLGNLRRAAAGALAGLLLLLAAPPPGLAAQAEAGAPSVLVLTHALDPEAERTFRTVMAASLRLALERRGLAVLQESRPATATGLAADPAGLLARGAEVGADYVLAADYGSAGRDLEIRLGWYDPGSTAPGAALTRRGRQDLALDRLILEAAEEILRTANPVLAGSPPRPVESPAMQSPTGTPPLAGQTPGSAAGLPPGTGSPNLPAGGIPPQTAEGPQRRKHVDVGLGVAPFVTTGSASEYFKLGIVPVLNIAFLFPGEKARFGLGLYAGANLFRAEGALESASAFLVPAGIALRYELGEQRMPLILFGLAGGPAVIGLTTSEGKQLSGLTFFGRGSLGFRLPIGDFFGIAAEAGYDIYWEQPYPIMGFCPAVYATIRL
jgi:hypothetical protein